MSVLGLVRCNGEIRAGDVFQKPVEKEGEFPAWSFVWGRSGDKIELRTYRNPGLDRSYVITLGQLACDWALIRPNEHPGATVVARGGKLV